MPLLKVETQPPWMHAMMADITPDDVHGSTPVLVWTNLPTYLHAAVSVVDNNSRMALILPATAFTLFHLRSESMLMITCAVPSGV